MAYSEGDTRSKLIDPAIHARGWTEDLIRREETAGAIELLDGRPNRRKTRRIDYTLRIKVAADSQPVALALIEAKAEGHAPDHGLEQGKLYAQCKRLNVPFVFSSTFPGGVVGAVQRGRPGRDVGDVLLAPAAVSEGRRAAASGRAHLPSQRGQAA